MKQKNGQRPPLFGKQESYRGSVASMDAKWHVRLYDVKVYFFGFKIAAYIDERLHRGPLQEVS